jgi:uncharacterized protein involved in outer membrane biogenesis
LYQVAIHDSRGTALAGWDHLAVNLSWRALWQGEIRLERVDVAAPWVDLTIDDTGGLNLAAALKTTSPTAKKQTPKAAGGGRPFHLVIQAVRLQDGRFSFRSDPTSAPLTIDAITLHAEGNLADRSAALEAVLENIRFNRPNFHLQPTRLQLKADLDQKAARAVWPVSHLTGRI